MDGTELPPIGDLVPHRGALLLLDCVLQHEIEQTTTRVVVDRQTWLTDRDGSVASWLALEYMAQCVAVHEGIRAHLEGRPPVRGALAAARGVRMHRSCFEPGDVLEVRTRPVGGRPGLGVLAHFCTICERGAAKEGKLIVEGRLSISVPRPGEPT